MILRNHKPFLLYDETELYTCRRKTNLDIKSNIVLKLNFILVLSQFLQTD